MSNTQPVTNSTLEKALEQEAEDQGEPYQKNKPTDTAIMIHIGKIIDTYKESGRMPLSQDAPAIVSIGIDNLLDNGLMTMGPQGEVKPSMAALFLIPKINMLRSRINTM